MDDQVRVDIVDVKPAFDRLASLFVLTIDDNQTSVAPSSNADVELTMLVQGLVDLFFRVTGLPVAVEGVFAVRVDGDHIKTEVKQPVCDLGR